MCQRAPHCSSFKARIHLKVEEDAQRSRKEGRFSNFQWDISNKHSLFSAASSACVHFKLNDCIRQTTVNSEEREKSKCVKIYLRRVFVQIWNSHSSQQADICVVCEWTPHVIYQHYRRLASIRHNVVSLARVTSYSSLPSTTECVCVCRHIEKRKFAARTDLQIIRREEPFWGVFIDSTRSCLSPSPGCRLLLLWTFFFSALLWSREKILREASQGILNECIGTHSLLFRSHFLLDFHFISLSHLCVWARESHIFQLNRMVVFLCVKHSVRVWIFHSGEMGEIQFSIWQNMYWKITVWVGFGSICDVKIGEKSSKLPGEESRFWVSWWSSW